MKNLFLVCLLMLGLGLVGCGSLSTDPCPDGEICGDGCMPTGADCCPNESGYCDVGETCTASNMCTSSGGGDGGGGGGGSWTGGVTSNCYCPGDNQCSQIVGCLQSCTCYYTINGSDGTSAWYLVKRDYTEAGSCYMCVQEGLSPNCTGAAQSAAAAAAALIAAGQCSY